MSTDLQTILGLGARHALTTFAGILVTDGYLQSSSTEQFVAAGMLILGIAWSYWQKTGQAKVAAEFARLKTAKQAVQGPQQAPNGAKA